MIRTIATSLRALPLVAVLLLVGAGAAAAADDYTLPFYNPSVVLSYGMDRDPRVSVQLDYTGKTWWDGVPHFGRVYDNHTGLDYPMALYSTIAAAKDGTVVDVEGGYGTQQYGTYGNFVRVRHTDGRQTLYYHLASSADGGLLTHPGVFAPAGEPLGLSGCSGLCNGAHLHFEVLVEQGQDLIPSDPMYRRLWTTWPGRVPFLGGYVRESNAGTEVIQRGRTITHWVEFRNRGGRTWRPNVSMGRIYLATWKPAAHASLFRAADWPYTWVATTVDQSAVAPDGIGRFTFGLRGNPNPGSYRETFNLLSNSVRWFDHAALSGFYIPIIVTNLQE
jgi:murein DD-endopeptidase MepM/ murein hydrolase activator NlpD